MFDDSESTPTGREDVVWPLVSGDSCDLLRSVLPLVTATGLASGAPAESCAMDAIAQVDRITTVSAYGAHVVWSDREPQTGRVAIRVHDVATGGERRLAGEPSG